MFYTVYNKCKAPLWWGVPKKNKKKSETEIAIEKQFARS